MPHIIVEHTEDIPDVSDLLCKLHYDLAEKDTVSLGAIKTRSILIQNAIIGEGLEKSMVHIAVKLLSGRSDELLNKISGDLHAISLAHCDDQTSVTVETISLHDDSYKK